MKLDYAGEKYSGNKLTHFKQNESKGIYLMPYYPDGELVRAVEIARLLKRPLLLRGEPGCGKTRLAEALAYELYGDDYQDHYFTWSIASTSKAKDGVYTFDHVGRLREVQLQKTKLGGEFEEEDLEKYVNHGPLGKALKASDRNHPAILLIDEIDKADIDFPNDLLDVLEWKPGKAIEIQEAKTKIDIKYPPIVVITSNDERELPKAFLRRCVFHYIEFPEEEKLFNIVKANLEAIENQPFNEVGLKELISDFLQLRLKVDRQVVSEKLPSTSELIDWVFAKAYYEMNGIKIDRETESIDFLGVLLKTETDYKVNRKST